MKARNREVEEPLDRRRRRYGISTQAIPAYSAAVGITRLARPGEVAMLIVAPNVRPISAEAVCLVVGQGHGLIDTEMFVNEEQLQRKALFE